MAKRKETLQLEASLDYMTREKGIYGCEEITIGFVGKGHGNEIVDFMTMDSKGIIRCYEIKVTVQDLKSKAAKSWYGNYNYLCVSLDLFNKIPDWTPYLPDGVGLIVGTESSFNPKGTLSLQTIVNPKKREVDLETQIMLKESMVRSMYYKMQKYKDAKSLEKQKELQAEARRWEKYYREEKTERREELRNQGILLRLYRKLTGKRISIEDLIDEYYRQCVEKELFVNDTDYYI